MVDDLLSSNGLIEAVNLVSSVHKIDVVIYSMEDLSANIIYKTDKSYRGIPIYLLYKETIENCHVSFLFDLALR